MQFMECCSLRPCHACGPSILQKPRTFRSLPVASGFSKAFGGFKGRSEVPPLIDDYEDRLRGALRTGVTVDPNRARPNSLGQQLASSEASGCKLVQIPEGSDMF